MSRIVVTYMSRSKQRRRQVQEQRTVSRWPKRANIEFMHVLCILQWSKQYSTSEWSTNSPNTQLSSGETASSGSVPRCCVSIINLFFSTYLMSNLQGAIPFNKLLYKGYSCVPTTISIPLLFSIYLSPC